MAKEAAKTTVQNLPDGLDHISTGPEIESILEDIGYDDKGVFNSLFVSTQDDGSYEEIWGCRYAVPFLHHTCWRIKG